MGLQQNQTAEGRFAALLEEHYAFSPPRRGEVYNATILSLNGNGVIVDYKTGGHNEALAAQYEWQLRRYAAALRALNGAAPEKGMLCYLDQEGVPCTEFPFTAAMLDETEQRMRSALAEMAAEFAE